MVKETGQGNCSEKESSLITCIAKVGIDNSSKHFPTGSTHTQPNIYHVQNGYLGANPRPTTRNYITIVSRDDAQILFPVSSLPCLVCPPMFLYVSAWPFRRKVRSSVPLNVFLYLRYSPDSLKSHHTSPTISERNSRYKKMPMQWNEQADAKVCYPTVQVTRGWRFLTQFRDPFISFLPMSSNFMS